MNAATWDFFTGTRATLEGAYVRPRLAGFVDFQDQASPLVTATLRRELTDADLVRRLDELAATLLAEPGARDGLANPYGGVPDADT